MTIYFCYTNYVIHILCSFKRWNFPHCIGSIDGKHIRLQKPAHTGSLYHNYKSYESMVLLAICDAEYNFVMVDIGQPGSISDGGIWENSEMGKKFANGKLYYLHTKICSLGPQLWSCFHYAITTRLW